MTRHDQTLLGREGELGVLRSALERAVSASKPALVAVEAEAGAGKSSLIHRFQRDAQRQHPSLKIAYGQAKARLSSSNGYQPAREALASLAEGEENRQRLRAANTLGRALVATAPDWLNAVPAVGDLLVAAYSTYKEVNAVQQARIADSVPRQFTRVIEGILSTGPLILALDDLHWADVSTIDLLTSLASDIQDGPLLLLLAFRPLTSAQDPHPYALQEHLLHLERYHRVEHLPLSPLSDDDLAQIWHARAGVRPTPELLKQASTLCSGNPLYMHEYASLYRLDHVGQEDDHSGVFLKNVPRKIEAVIEQRLLSLDPDEMRVLEVAAVLGVTFDPTDLVMLCDQGDRQTRAALRSLTRRQRLVRPLNDSIGSRYAFEHQTIHTVVERRHRTEDPFDYGSLHREAADLQSAKPESLHQRLQISHHLLESGDARGALQHATRAAELALSISAYPEVWKILEPWLQGNTVAHEHPEASRLALQGLTLIGDHTTLVDIWPKLAKQARDDPCCQLQAARAFRMVNDWSAAEALCQSVEESGSPDEVIEAHILRGEILLCGRPQRSAEALRAFTRVVDKLRGSPSPELVRATGHLGLSLLSLGEADAAMEHLDKAIRIAEATDSPYDEYEAVHWRCKGAIAQLDLDLASRLLDRQEALSSRSGTASTTPFHLRDKSRVTGLRGEMDRAGYLYGEYLAITTQGGSTMEFRRALVNGALQAYEASLVCGKSNALSLANAMQANAKGAIDLRDLMRAVLYAPDFSSVLSRITHVLEAHQVDGRLLDDAEAIFRFDIPDFWLKRANLHA